MTRAPHAAQINLGFGNSPRQLMNLGGGGWSGNFTRECLNFFRRSGVGKNG